MSTLDGLDSGDGLFETRLGRPGRILMPGPPAERFGERRNVP